MLIIWLKVRGFLELEKFGESANPCATERVNDISNKFYKPNYENWSQAILFVVPGEVLITSIYQQKSRGFTVTWLDPTVPNGVILGYNISWQDVKMKGYVESKYLPKDHTQAVLVITDLGMLLNTDHTCFFL